ncbi:MAG TPA: MBL fold metallo-hydrolase [Actinomycetota bacterium]|nr:MBL fold metallo-hydrolase [Actinomycetota bacterium]
MLLERFVNGRARSNAYVYAPDDRRALIVDAGHGAAAKIEDLVRAEGLQPQAVVLTHGHPDHIWTARALSDRYEIPAYIHRSDVMWFDDPATGGNLPLFRFAGRLYGRSRRLRPRRLQAVAGDAIDAGGFRVGMLHTPGHTGGSVCFLVDDICFSGDTVFNGGVGQTAYPGGSRRRLRESIRSKLLPLHDDLRVLPGHGRETTIGAERELWERFTRAG